MALNTTSQEEGDPLISCPFKTEFLVHLQQRTNGAVQVNIGPSCVLRSLTVDDCTSPRSWR